MVESEPRSLGSFLLPVKESQEGQARPAALSDPEGDNLCQVLTACQALSHAAEGTAW